MSYTTVCPSCGGTLRLLDRYRGCKIMCPGCRKPFLAVRAADEALDVESPPGALPARGWLLVCPSCGHTAPVADAGGSEDRCPACGAALLAPRTPSKPLRRKEG